MSERVIIALLGVALIASLVHAFWCGMSDEEP